MKGHLSNDDLIDRLYGAGDPKAGTHLEQCPSCAKRLAAFERRRAQSADLPPVSTGFLASQRHAICERLESPENGRVRWAPALVAACLVAAGVYYYYPPYPSAPAQKAQVVIHAESNDQQLFSDVYSMEQSAEPSAADPIHALFEADGE